MKHKTVHLVSIILIFSCCLKLAFLQCSPNYEYQFVDAVTSSSSCLPCNYNCINCFNSSICNQCAPQYYLSAESSECVECRYGCSICSGDQQCTVCQNGLYLNGDGQCLACDKGVSMCTIATIEECLNGYFRLAGICAGCFQNCLTCNDFLTCTKCSTKYFLQVINGTQICSSCSSNCEVCTSNNNCNLCSRGYSIINGLCVLQNCQSISPFCSRCFGLTCSECKKGYYIQSGICQQGSSILCNQAFGTTHTQCETSNYGCPSYAEVQIIDQQSLDICLPKRYTQQIQYIYHLNTNILCASGSCSEPLASQIQIMSKPYYKFTYHLNIKLYSKSIHTIIVTHQDTNITLTHNVNITDNIGLGNIECSGCSYGQITLEGTLNAYGFNKTTISVKDSSASFAIVEYIFELSLCKVIKCQKCSTAIDCTVCIYPYLLQLIKCVQQCDSGFYQLILNTTRQCVLQCPSNTYPIQSTYECSECQSPCLTCVSPTKCLSCVSGFFLEGDKCVSQCSSTKLFPNITSKVCQECLNPCTTCYVTNITNEVKCLSCNIGYLLQNDSSCTYSCPTTTFGNFINEKSVCSQCDSKCTECFLRPQTCNGCINGYLLSGNQCFLTTNCSSGYFPINKTILGEVKNNICERCHYPCQQCSGKDTNCLSCRKGTLLLNINNPNSNNSLNICPMECPSGMFILTISNLQQCQPCQFPCITCSTALNCITCANNTYLLNYQCLLNCPQTHYKSLTKNQCLPCQFPCQLCLNSTACLSCTTGYLQPLLFKCTLQCLSNEYVSSSFICNQCIPPCIQCFGALNCTRCSLPLVLKDGNCISESQCSNSTLSSNGVGKYSQYYRDINQTILYGICKLCTYPCKICNGSSIVCLSCAPSYILVSQLSTCVDQCPSSYFQNETLCQKCSATCLQCFNTSTTCIKCPSGQFLHLSSCFISCPNQYYGSNQGGNGGKCYPCQSPCLLCYNSYLCQTCVPGLLLSNKNCIQSCPEGTTQNSITNPTQCVMCTTGCSACSNIITNCTSCASGYLYMAGNNSCGSSCGPGYFGNLVTQLCEQCISPCLECSSSVTCISCVSNYYLQANSNECYSTCPDGMYSNNSTMKCEGCNLTICNTCIDSPNGCITCALGYYHNGTNCITTCPNITYADLFSGKCKQCPFPCVTCMSATFCSSCQLTYKLFSNRCYSQCPLGYFSDSLNQCQKCQSTCQICTSNTTCLKCLQNYYVELVGNTCVIDCPIGTYKGIQPITNYQQCRLCVINCLQCTQSFKCNKCVSNLTLFNGLCLSQCPSLYFETNYTVTNYSGKKCMPCSSNCNKCVNQTYCVECLNAFIYENKCYEKCPSQTYSFSDSQCRKCKTPCKQCLGDYSCITCISGYTYFHQYCILECPKDVWYYSGQPKCLQECQLPNNRLLTSVLSSTSNKNSGLSLIKYPHPKMCFDPTQGCGPMRNLVVNNNYCLQTCPDNNYVNQNYECKQCSTNPSICKRLLKASLKALRSQALTLVIYFNQKVQITTIDRILIQFVNLDGQIIKYDYNSYIIEDYQIRIVYGYQQLSLVQVTVVLPYLKSQDTNQCIFTNVLNAKINFYRSYASFMGVGGSNTSSQIRSLQSMGTNQSSYNGNPILSVIIMIAFILILIFMMVNIVINESNFLQIVDFSQIVALTLYLEIQFPPILEKTLLKFGLALLNFLPTTKQYPYQFSQSKFITYNLDSSIKRQIFLISIFIALLSLFAILLIIQQIRKKCKQSELQYTDKPNQRKVRIQQTHKTIESNIEDANDVKCYDNLLTKLINRIVYRNLNDTFSLLMAPVLLFSSTLIGKQIQQVVLSLIIIGVSIAFVIVIVYKILNIKKLSELTGLLSDLEPTSSIIGLMYTPFSHLRRIILCMLIGLQPTKPLSTLTLLLIFTILIMVCLIFYQPFKNQFSDYVSIGTEIILVGYVLLLMAIGINVVNNNISWIIAILACVLVVVGLVGGTTWFIWLTILDVRIWCKPEKVDNASNAEQHQQHGIITRQIQVSPQIKQQKLQDEPGLKKQEGSGQQLINPNKIGSMRGDDLFSSSNQNNQGFRHWGEQSSEQGNNNRDHKKDPPQYLIKMTKNI